MIERKYTGIAKQGADVVANPTLDGSEQALNSIQINGENFKIEGGGSGKLKLVYESDESSAEYKNVKLEKDKIYLLEVKGQHSEEITGTIKTLGEGYSISSSVMFDYDSLTLFYVYYGTNDFSVCKCEDDSSYEINGIKVYELEFGGSSGGVEKEQYRLENVQLICESNEIKIDVPTLKKNKIYHFHMNTSMGYVANFNFYIGEYGTSNENIGFYYDIDENTTICNLHYEENNSATNKPAIMINAYEDVELLEETADYIIISEV